MSDLHLVYGLLKQDQCICPDLLSQERILSLQLLWQILPLQPFLHSSLLHPGLQSGHGSCPYIRLPRNREMATVICLHWWLHIFYLLMLHQHVLHVTYINIFSMFIKYNMVNCELSPYSTTNTTVPLLLNVGNIGVHYCWWCVSDVSVGTLLSPSTVITGIPSAFTCCLSPGPMAVASCCRIVKVCWTCTTKTVTWTFSYASREKKQHLYQKPIQTTFIQY